MSDLFHDLPRGNGQNGQSPDSAFKSPETIARDPSLAFAPGKIFLGQIGADIRIERFEDGRLFPYALGGHPVGLSGDQHMITVAGSRSGKGRAAIIPNLLTYTGSVLATDPKGELASITGRYRAEGLGQTVHVLDPFGITSEKVEPYRKNAIFNPLSILDPDDSIDIVGDAGLIADALIVPGGGDTHWDETARNFVEGVILHVVTHEKYKAKRDLVTVRDLVMGQNPSLQEEMKSNIAASNAIVDAAADFFDKTDKEREGVLSTARRHLHFLTYQPIQNVLRGESIDLKTLKTDKVTIYVCLPAMRMSSCFRWFRLLVNLTLAAMEQEKTRPPLPVLMCLDEFAVLGHLKSLEDAAGQIAGLSCKLWPILQDLGQLKTLYSDRWETFMGNAGILQFFGNSDLTTLEWISKRMGTTTINTQSKSDITWAAKAGQGQTGKSWAPNIVELMTLEEVSRFFGRDDPLLRQLIIRPGEPPMILQRAYYDKHELFEGKYDTEEGI
jgi:type IV secretion system protein VirD4